MLVTLPRYTATVYCHYILFRLTVMDKLIDLLIGVFFLLNICRSRYGYQVIGAVLGVKLIQFTFPNVGKGARLSVGAHHGALAEGLATFMVVMVSVTLKKKEMKSFFMKTWITSIWKNTIHILSSDITGGIMNPASVSLSARALLISNLQMNLLDFMSNSGDLLP